MDEFIVFININSTSSNDNSIENSNDSNNNNNNNKNNLIALTKDNLIKLACIKLLELEYINYDRYKFILENYIFLKQYNKYFNDKTGILITSNGNDCIYLKVVKSTNTTTTTTTNESSIITININ